MRLTILALVAAIFAAAVLPARAQSPETGRRIDGTVVDAQGPPVVGAQITLAQPQGNLTRTATSSTERFHFDNLSPGAYTLRVTATGFQLQQVQIDLTTDSGRTIEVRLEPARVTEQTIVTATRSEQRF